MRPITTLLVLGLIMLAAGNASAGIGIAKDFLQDNTMVMNPGEERTYQVYLTNTDSNTIQVRLLLRVAPPLKVEQANNEDVVVLPAKTYNKGYSIKITAPSDIPTGQKYKVNVILTSAATGSGMVTIANELSEHFFVQIGNAPVANAISAPSLEAPPLERNTTIGVKYEERLGVTVDYFDRANRNSVGFALAFTTLLLGFTVLFKQGTRNSRMSKSLIGALIAAVVIYALTESVTVVLPMVRLFIVEVVLLIEFIILVMAFLDAGRHTPTPSRAPTRPIPPPPQTHAPAQPHHQAPAHRSLSQEPQQPVAKQPFKPRRRDEMMGNQPR